MQSCEEKKENVILGCINSSKGSTTSILIKLSKRQRDYLAVVYEYINWEKILVLNRSLV